MNIVSKLYHATSTNSRIIDEFTNLPVSRQRKWQLRHLKKAKEIADRYQHSLKGIVTGRERKRRKFHFKNRNLNSKSYKMEQEVRDKNISQSPEIIN